MGHGGNADERLGDGWSAGEDGFRWMVNERSELWLDHPGTGTCRLMLDLHPHTALPARPAQRVIIRIGGTEVYRADVAKPGVCDVPVPPAALASSESLFVTIDHPDAFAPAEVAGNDDTRGDDTRGDDTRRLALAVREVRLYRPSLLMAAPVAPVVVGRAARPTVVFVGNCQMDALAVLYRRLHAGNPDRHIVYMASYAEATDADREIVANASILVQQVLDFVPAIGDLPTRGRVYLVPHATAAFLWPFGGTPHPLNQPEPMLDPSGPYPAELGDTFLNRLIAGGIPADQAVGEYLAASVPKLRRLDRLMELHLARQRDRDTACDIPIAHRIEAQFPSVRLFSTPNHPEASLALWIARQVFGRMGEGAESIGRMLADAPEVMPPSEMPIHPSVAEYFGLQYAAPDRRYRYFNEGRFTFAEFASRYMRYEWNAALAEGLHLLSCRQTAAGVAKLRPALDASPCSAIGHMALADALVTLGQMHEAVFHARRALEIEPANAIFARRMTEISAGAGGRS
jgi:hypothetical protein